MHLYRILTAILFTVPASLHAAEVCAHRGDVAVAPENTIAAFVSAVEKGVGMIEFDVQLSKDGRLVIMHDPSVNRTTNGKGLVERLTFKVLRALDAGSWFAESFTDTQIPTLEETLESIPKTILCNVHLKNSPGVASASAKLIEKLDRLDHCFLACSTEQAKEARAVVPEIQICNMSRQGGDRSAYIDLTIETDCDFIQLHQNNGLDNIEQHLKRLHEHGIKVNYFGSQDPDMIKQLHKAGIDYILTDDVDLCENALSEKEKSR
ncbi:MAG: glycerophosphodiester phosphodiesterase family protein [Candidatus Hydrogenedentota bacterium]